MFVLKWLGTLFLKGLNGIVGTIGKTIVDVHTSTTERQKSENQSGGQLAGTWIAGHNEAGRTRADVHKSQGAWGPFNVLIILIGSAIAYHTWMVVLDSTPWHIVPTFKFYIVPWLEWKFHEVGSWKVAALPGLFEQTEHSILNALFYTAPPSAAAVAIAKTFMRR